MNEERVNFFKYLFDKEGDKEDSTILNIVFVSFISSDSYATIDQCKDSLEQLKAMDEGLKKSTIKMSKKMEWQDRIDNGIKICERDLLELMKVG